MPSRATLCRILLLLLAGFHLPALRAQTLQLTPADMLRRAVPGQPAPARAAPKAGQQPEKPPAPVIEPVAQAYLYLEPGQARFEALFDAASLMRMLDPSAPLPPALDAASGQRLLAALAQRAEAWCQVSESGVLLRRAMPAPALLTGRPGATLPLEPGQEPPLGGVIVGLTWVFDLPPSPEEIETHWQGHLPGGGSLPVTLFYGPRSEASTPLTRESATLAWKNLGRLPAPAPLVEIPAIHATGGFRLPLGFLLWLLAGLLLWLAARKRHRHRHHRLPGGIAPWLIVWAASAVPLWPRLPLSLPGIGGPASGITRPEQAAPILEPLLLNAYRAFDQRGESAIYDVLARSVHGELLRRLYLETLQALSLEGREGARVTIQEFSADVDKVTPADAGFTADCQWTALGTVGHWGHTHTRVNRYTARVTVSPVEGAWKITALEVLETVRL